MPEASAQTRGRTRTRVGAAVLVLAIAAVWYAVRSRDSDGADTGCALTGADLVALSAALVKGHTPDQVIRLGGRHLAGPGCQRAVTHLLGGGAATVDVEGPKGTTRQFLTFPELTHPASGTLVDETGLCDGWRTIDSAFQLCLNGDLAAR